VRGLGTHARGDARGRHLGWEGTERWKICCWAQRAEHSQAAAGGISETGGGAWSGTSGKPEEDPKQWLVAAPTEDQGGGEASRGVWGVGAGERDGTEGLGTEETVVGAPRPCQAGD